MKRHPSRSRFSRHFHLHLEPLEERCLLAVNVTTYHNDLGRTGLDSQETILRPANVNAAHFGQLFSYDNVDGKVFTQPLYMSNVRIPGRGIHNVVFIATEHDSLYALDADSGDPALGGGVLWQDSFIDPANGITPIPSDENEGGTLGPEVGITGTPVINPNTNTLYVVAATKEVSDGGTRYVQRLYAVDIRTGALRFGGGVEINATVPGTGDGSVDGQIIFDPLIQNQRPGLLLSRGVVYITWASFNDAGPYHGWIMGYSTDLSQMRAVNITPNGDAGGIWMSGAAPAADDGGLIFLSVGNGDFAPALRGGDYGMSVAVFNHGLRNTDYFAPYNWQDLDNIDADLGSGGVMFPPDQQDGSPPLLVTMGKEGVLYVLDRTNLGGFNADGDIVHQEIRNASTHGGSYSTPAYFDGRVYYIFNFDVPEAYALSGGYLSETPVSQGSDVYGFGFGGLSISSNGDHDGIVWAVQGDAFTDQFGVLHAYDANDLSHELYNSTQNGPADQIGVPTRFEVPTVANGKVYITTEHGLAAYGLFSVLTPPMPVGALVHTSSVHSSSGLLPASSPTPVIGHVTAVPTVFSPGFESPLDSDGIGKDDLTLPMPASSEPDPAEAVWLDLLIPGLADAAGPNPVFMGARGH
jgi:hypothetical protein